MTLLQIFHQKVYDDFGFISPTWHLDPGVGAIIRAVVALTAIPAALIVARTLPGDRQGAANLVVWALAALFALRVLEPELVPYFLAPALALGPIERVARSMVATGDHLRRRRVADLVAARPRYRPDGCRGCSWSLNYGRPWMACASPSTAAVRRRSAKSTGAQTGTPASGSAAPAGSDGACGLIQRAPSVTSWIFCSWPFLRGRFFRGTLAVCLHRAPGKRTPVVIVSEAQMSRTDKLGITCGNCKSHGEVLGNANTYQCPICKFNYEATRCGKCHEAYLTDKPAWSTSQCPQVRIC